MSPAVHSFSVPNLDSFDTAELHGFGSVAVVLLLCLAIHSFFFNILSALELIAFGIGFLIILFPPVLLSWLPNYKTNMSSAIVNVCNFFTVTLVLGCAVLATDFMLSRKQHHLELGHSNDPSLTRRIVAGIVVLILILSPVLLERLRNSKTNMSSTIISSEVHSSTISYSDIKTVVWRRIRKTLSLFHYSGVSRAPVREPPAWRLNYKIGSGACGTVFLENVQTRDMKSPELWAVKRVPRAFPNFTFKRYQAEIKNLEALSRHEWFVKFNSTYEDAHYRYIAMEYIPMGDMSQSFVDGYRWSESDTKVVIKQLLHGLAVMHKEGITHRDLKPENIFLYLPEDQTHVLRVKIGDFGTSKRVPHSNASTDLKTTTGTQGYMAPEMHDTSKAKTNKVGIWSLGCVLYRMFTGNHLFNDPVEVFKYAQAGSSLPLPLDNIGFSILCIHFLHGILHPRPNARLSAEDCLGSPWIANEAPIPEYSIGMDLYARLSKINHLAPNVHSFPDVVTNRATENSSVL